MVCVCMIFTISHSQTFYPFSTFSLSPVDSICLLMWIRWTDFHQLTNNKMKYWLMFCTLHKPWTLTKPFRLVICIQTHTKSLFKYRFKDKQKKPAHGNNEMLVFRIIAQQTTDTLKRIHTKLHDQASVHFDLIVTDAIYKNLWTQHW